MCDVNWALLAPFVCDFPKVLPSRYTPELSIFWFYQIKQNKLKWQKLCWFTAYFGQKVQDCSGSRVRWSPWPLQQRAVIGLVFKRFQQRAVLGLVWKRFQQRVAVGLVCKRFRQRAVIGLVFEHFQQRAVISLVFKHFQQRAVISLVFKHLCALLSICSIIGNKS